MTINVAYECNVGKYIDYVDKYIVI